MADGLFSYKTPGQLQQDYLGGLIQPVGGGNLYSQLVQTMSNAGRMMGYGAGRMFGGQVPGEEKNAAIQSVFEQVKGIADLAEQYNKAAELFAQSGFPDLAMQARKTAQQEQLTGLQLRKTTAEVKELEGKPEREAAAAAAALNSRTNMLRVAGLSQEDAAIYAEDEQLTRDIVKEARKPGVQKLTFKTVGDKVVALDSKGNIVKTIGDAPKAASTTVVLNNASDAVDFTQKYDNLMKSERTAYQGARDGMRLLNEAAQKGDAEGNVSAWNAARTVIAKALGDGRLSNADIERLGGSAGLFRAVEDIISKAFTGTPSPETQAQLYRVAKIIELAKIEQMNRITNQAREVYKQDFPEKASEARLNLYFPKAPVPFGSLR